MKPKLIAKPRKVVIHVRGGVAYVEDAPKDVDVEIVDFDNREEEERDAKGP
jgi:uncharacterized protein YbjT (DUF2867 family)